MDSVQCPSRDIISNWAWGNLDDDTADFVADHVDACSVCEELLAEIEEGGLLKEANIADADSAYDQELGCHQFVDYLQKQVIQRKAREDIAATTGFQGTPSTPTQPSSQNDQRLPVRIGRYSIRRVIASGGMGTVYEAEQEQPQRTVALKVMKAGIASKEHLRRFEYESQLLARLRHPAIADVYDAGTHGTGTDATPYFVMEFVPDAQLITHFVEQNNLSLHRKLTLFCSVCDAIAHGHSRGIIHRDIKPQNILVSGDGSPKVIDFGVARMTDVDNFAATQQTEVGQLIGTLQYMSPEQTEADPGDLDIRSDVYSLGLLFYEMLTGNRPYDVSRTNIFEATRIVREQDPRRPSAFDSQLRGDLETILLKSLTKNRDNRYQSAEALVADVRRYLNHEPIAARPPSVTYQVRKFAQRNKPLVAGVIASVAALLVGLCVSTWMYLLADDARDQAVLAQRDAEFQRDQANDAKGKLADQLAITASARDAQRKAKEQAQIESATSTAVNEYLNQILSSASPDDLGRNVTVAEALDHATREIDTAFADQPRVEAEVRMTLGSAYANLGRYDVMEVHFRRAADLWEQIAGPEDRETLYAKHRLVRALDYNGHEKESEELQREVLAAQLRKFGEDDEDTRASMEELAEISRDRGNYDEAEKLLRRVIESHRRTMAGEDPLALKATDIATDALKAGRTMLGLGGEERAILDAQRIFLRGEHPDTLSTMGQLAAILRERGELDEAEAIYRQVYDARKWYFGDEDTRTLRSMERIGAILERQGRVEEAERWYQKTYVGRRKVLGESHDSTLAVMTTLYHLYHDRGAYDEAETMARRIHAGYLAFVGPSHDDTLDAIQAIGYSLHKQNRFAEAQAFYERFLDACDDDKLVNSATRRCAYRLANALYSQGKYGEANDYYARVVRYYEQLEPSSPMTLEEQEDYAESLHSLGRIDEALTIFQQIATAYEETYGETHASTLAAKKRMGLSLRNLNRNAEAAELYREVLERQIAALGEEHRESLSTKNSLGNILRQLDQYEEAERLHREVLAAREETLGKEHYETLYTAHCLAKDLENQWRLDESTSLYQRALEGRRKVLGAAQFATADSFVRTIISLLKQGKNDVAESLARDYLKELEERLPSDHYYIATNRRWLVLALLAQNKAADAEPIVRQNILILQKHTNQHPAQLLGAQSDLAHCLLVRGKAAEAEKSLRECLTKLTESLTEDHPAISATKARLGNAMLLQDKHEDAESQLAEALPKLRDAYGDKYFATVAAYHHLLDAYEHNNETEKMSALRKSFGNGK